MDMAFSILTGVESVTKAWTKQRKAEERQHGREVRRRQALVKSRRVTIRDAAFAVMRAAYLKVSSEGRWPAKARQIMYEARGPIQDQTGEMLDDRYFTQTLLPDFIAEHPEAAAWNVVFDARGHFTEPHTKRRIGLGTLEVRDYLQAVPPHCYGAILFIEKEGFDELFAAAKLAERYDLAIMSSKGLASTAARELVERLCSTHGAKLLVAHDLDKAGFSIVGTLRRNTRRYAFTNRIEVIDIGLRLEQVEAYHLADEEFRCDQRAAANLRLNGATEEEIDFLCSGRRVELNAFASADIIACLEAEFQKHGVKKIVPNEQTLKESYRNAAAAQLFAERSRALKEQCQRDAQQIKPPPGLKAKVRAAFDDDAARPWGAVVAELANGAAQDFAR